MGEGMDKRVDGWMDGEYVCMDGWMGAWMDAWIEKATLYQIPKGN